MSGVQIVASTGYHLPQFYFKDSWLHDLNAEELKEIFLSELECGMFPFEQYAHTRPGIQTAIRAGMVKAAIGDNDIGGRCAQLLSAAAAAAADADVPLMLHTEHGMHSLQAVHFCMRLGLSPHRIIICHVDRRTDNLSLHKELGHMGVFLDYDTICREKYHTNADEIELLMRMLDWGFEDQILLALDTTAARLHAYGGTPGLSGLLLNFLPRLPAFGIPAEIIHKFNNENCIRVFS